MMLFDEKKGEREGNIIYVIDFFLSLVSLSRCHFFLPLRVERVES